MKVWVQANPEMMGHRRASDQVEHRKASLEVPYLRERHRLASYQGAEEAVRKCSVQLDISSQVLRCTSELIYPSLNY